MDADGSNPKQLTNATDMRPQCSADGQWIYYTSIANNFSLWKVPVDGGDPVPVHTGGQVIGAALSPDGKEIACNYQESGGTASVLTILSAVDGSIVKTFDAQTQPANNRGEILKWTADGRGILYVDEPKGGSNLWIQPRDGGPPKQLTDFTSDHIVSFAMSPDGRQLALSRGIFTDDVVMISNSK
jgi:Tol biopolymer transport system component